MGWLAARGIDDDSALIGGDADRATGRSQAEVDFDATLNAYYRALAEKKWAEANRLTATLTPAADSNPVIGSFGKWLRSVTQAGQGRNAAAEALLTALPNTDPAPPELQ